MNTHTRRTFLAVGGAALLTACGSSSDDSSATDPLDATATSGTGSTASDPPDATAPSGTGSTAGGNALAAGTTLARRYPQTALSPGMVRLPISLVGASQTLLETGPATLTATLVDADGNALGSYTASRRADGIVIPYWPFEVQVDGPGSYDLLVDGAGEDGAAFVVLDPADVVVPKIGSMLAGFDTPTTDDARGVDPICTRSPDPCPFHDVTLTDALATGKPVVYIVGTPAHCQTGTCAPGLEFLIQAATTFAGKATFVHAEVYADNAATQTAPAVGAAGLDYEPVVFVTDGTGMVVARIDAVWDSSELDDILASTIA